MKRNYPEAPYDWLGKNFTSHCFGAYDASFAQFKAIEGAKTLASTGKR